MKACILSKSETQERERDSYLESLSIFRSPIFGYDIESVLEKTAERRARSSRIEKYTLESLVHSGPLSQKFPNLCLNFFKQKRLFGRGR